MQIQILTKHKYKYNCSLFSAGKEKKGEKFIQRNVDINTNVNKTQIQIQLLTLLEGSRKKELLQKKAAEMGIWVERIRL